MSETAPRGVYVYQPHSPQKRKDGRLWHVGGLPDGLTKEEAEAVADAINSICWLMAMCHRCGHTLRFEATACPRCGAAAEAPWDAGKKPLPRGKAVSRP